jgi:hypothetical protein
LFKLPGRLALSLALDKGGYRIASRIAMIAMTTRSSIRVKAATWQNNGDEAAVAFWLTQEYL